MNISHVLTFLTLILPGRFRMPIQGSSKSTLRSFLICSGLPLCLLGARSYLLSGSALEIIWSICQMLDKIHLAGDAVMRSTTSSLTQHVTVHTIYRWRPRETRRKANQATIIDLNLVLCFQHHLPVRHCAIHYILLPKYAKRRVHKYNKDKRMN